MKEEDIALMENNKGYWKVIIILVKVDEMYNTLKSVIATA